MGIASTFLGWLSLRRGEGASTRWILPPAYGQIAIGEPETAIPGCGWYDSSHDLRTGLVVIEGDALGLRLAVERMLLPEWAGR